MENVNGTDMHPCTVRAEVKAALAAALGMLSLHNG